MNASGRVRLTIDVGHPTPASSSVRSWPIADIAIRQAVAVLQRARGFAPRPYDWATVPVARAGVSETTQAVVTELEPLGTFATWQAERAVGDHDRSTLRLRLDPQGDASELEPGMTVWLPRR
jgi:hypothetical protein